MGIIDYDGRTADVRSYANDRLETGLDRINSDDPTEKDLQPVTVPVAASAWRTTRGADTQSSRDADVPVTIQGVGARSRSCRGGPRGLPRELPAAPIGPRPNQTPDANPRWEFSPSKRWPSSCSDPTEARPCG